MKRNKTEKNGVKKKKNRMMSPITLLLANVWWMVATEDVQTLVM